MKQAPLDPLARQIVRALYELAELDVAAHAGVLGCAVGHDAAEVVRALRRLDALGLVSADCVRLTLVGLAQAARLPALQLAREPWLEAARQRSRPPARTPRVEGPSALSTLRRCAGDAAPVPPRARRTS